MKQMRYSLSSRLSLCLLGVALLNLMSPQRTEGQQLMQICPKPQQATIETSEYVPLEYIDIKCPDPETAKWTRKHAREWFGKSAPEVMQTISSSLSLKEDSYILSTSERGVCIEAGSLQSARHAMFSLRQLAIPERGTLKVQGWLVPKAYIRDYPAFSFRGIHICWFPDTEAWEVERLIRLAAYYKFNYAVVEPWGTFRSSVAPWYGWKDGQMTKKEIKRLCKIANDLGVTLIPQLNVFGHATMSRGADGKHAALDMHPEYAPIFEPAGGWNFCLSSPATRELIINLISELHEAFGNPPYFHIGCDEAEPPSCPQCTERPYTELFVEHLKAINEAISKRGAHTMMWHDMLLRAGDERWKGFYANGDANAEETTKNLPKDIVVCDWFYGGPCESYPTLTYFKEQGFHVMTCPWLTVGGTLKQGEQGQMIGIDGILGTLWHHYFGSDLVNIYLSTAQAAWNRDPIKAYNESSVQFRDHLRHVENDMKIKETRQAGFHRYQIHRSELHN